MERERWYAVPRSYRVRDEVYVLASSAAEARERAENHDYAEASGQEPASFTRYGRSRRVDGRLADTLTRDNSLDGDR